MIDDAPSDAPAPVPQRHQARDHRPGPPAPDAQHLAALSDQWQGDAAVREAAWTWLHEHYHDYAYSRFGRILRGRLDAMQLEDLYYELQDEVRAGVTGFREEGHFAAWYRSIADRLAIKAAANAARDAVRAPSLDAAREAVAGAVAGSEAREGGTDDEPFVDPYGELSARDLLRFVQHCLSATDFVVFQRVKLEGYTHDEVVAELGHAKSAHASRQRLSAALRYVQVRLGRELGLMPHASPHAQSGSDALEQAPRDALRTVGREGEPLAPPPADPHAPAGV